MALKAFGEKSVGTKIRFIKYYFFSIITRGLPTGKSTNYPSSSLSLQDIKEIMSEEKSLNFLEEIIEADLKSGKYQQIITRFPPEPNGYLHIGHAASIVLNF